MITIINDDNKNAMMMVIMTRIMKIMTIVMMMKSMVIIRTTMTLISRSP